MIIAVDFLVNGQLFIKYILPNGNKENGSLRRLLYDLKKPLIVGEIVYNILIELQIRKKPTCLINIRGCS